MGKKKSRSSNTGKGAWRILRMAFVWAKKGGVFKRWTMLELRSLVPKYLKALSHHHHHDHNHHHHHHDHHHHREDYLFPYGEHELSFDETPMFHLKMHRRASMRFLFPCITPKDRDFDYDFTGHGHGHNDDPYVRSYGYDDCHDGVKCYTEGCDDVNGVNEEEEVNGIDVRAEFFIAKFYEQIKLQRQISFLQYKESNPEDDDKL